MDRLRVEALLLEEVLALGFDLDGLLLVVDPPRVRLALLHPASHNWA